MSVENVNYGQIFAEHFGKLVVVHMVGVGVNSAISPFKQMTMGTIPPECRPRETVSAAVYSSPSTAVIQVNPNGELNLLARDNKINPGWNVDGTLTYLAR